MTETAVISSPVGPIELVSDGTALVSATFLDDKTPTTPARAGVLARAAAQIERYFSGEAEQFDVPLAPKGTEFQLKVWSELQRIPWGQRISYLDLARRLGDPDAVRAVGAANGKNPIAIFIPCHRVVGADGALTGYAGGIHRKKLLLDLEAGVRELF